jgi:glycine/D-amino acid oxidase-like deaminating enzyme
MGPHKYIRPGKVPGHESLEHLIAQHGLEVVHEHAHPEGLIREGGIDCAFRRSGFLLAAYKPRHAAALQRTQEMLARDFGHTARWVPADRIREEIDSPVYHGALLEPADAGLNPARYIAGLLRMARELGVGLHEKVTALSVTRQSGGFTVATDRGPIRADAVVAATNGYTGPLTPWMRRRIVPVRSLMIATAPLPPERVQALIPRDRMIADTKVFLYYFRPSPDGRRLLFGGRPRFANRSLAENARHMRDNLVSVFPQLKSVGVDWAWWGRLGFTMDHLPHAGCRHGVYYAAGYCGHGVALATYLGAKLAGLIRRDTSGQTAFTDLTFRPIPFYDGRPWFLPLVYRWFNLRDRLF